MSIEATSRQSRAIRVKPAALRLNLLAQVALCIVPTMTGVAMGYFPLAGKYLFGSLLILLVYHIARGDSMAYLALSVGLVPAMMLLRDFFYFSSVTVILAGGVLLWAWPAPRSRLGDMSRNTPLILLIAGALIYWMLGWLLTGNYSGSLRILEMAFGAACVWIVARRRSYLATGLAGAGMSTFAMGMGLLPYGHRLGMAMIDGESSFGNPISFGLPAALVFLLTLALGGRWLLLDNRLFWRIVLNLMVGSCLLLSTSRGSWVVALAGIVILFLLERNNRRGFLLPLLPGVLCTILLLGTGRGQFIAKYFDMATSPDRTWAQRTTGRFNQWIGFPRVLAASPIWGHGPGKGVAANFEHRREFKAWHSLYLHVGAETGLLGLLALASLLATLAWRGLRHWRITNDAVPLAAVFCFMAIGISVNGFDAVSGVYLGIAFTAMDFTGMYVVRRVRYVARAPQPVAIA